MTIVDVISADPTVPRRETIPLSQLRSGDRAEVCRRDLCGEDCELLNAMGLTDRCHLRVCRAGRTCIIQVASTRLGLSAALARSIFVVPQEPASAGAMI